MFTPRVPVGKSSKHFAKDKSRIPANVVDWVKETLENVGKRWRMVEQVGKNVGKT